MKIAGKTGEGLRTYKQINEFIILLERIPENEKVNWFNKWIRPEIESSETQSEKMLEKLRKEVGNEGNENQGELLLW